MTKLLSWQGTLLCRRHSDSSLVQRPVTADFADATPIELDIPADALQVSFSHYLREDPALTHDIGSGPLAGCRLTRAKDGRSLYIVTQGGFLSAVHRAETVRLIDVSEDWECFLPIDEADLSVLRDILTGAWVIRSTAAPIAARTARLAEHFTLCLDDLHVDLRWQLPFDLAGWPHRLTLLRDGWRIEQICRYRPLVYFSAFGNEAIMRQFSICVRSLFSFGQYHGDIAVLSDHPPDTIAALLPDLRGQACAVLRSPARDRPAFMAARYTITNWPDAQFFQPLLYVDTDIVFDADINAMLHAIAVSDRIAAPVEPFAPMRSSAPSGAGLLQLDGCDPAFLHGFNSGTLGIPNLTAHAATLRLISRIIANNATIRGRDSLPYVDQEVANYVSYRLARFDTALIAPYVRVGGEDPVRLDQRRGLVHFWAVAGAARRADIMQAYADLLAIQQPPASAHTTTPTRPPPL